MWPKMFLHKFEVVLWVRMFLHLLITITYLLDLEISKVHLQRHNKIDKLQMIANCDTFLRFIL